MPGPGAWPAATSPRLILPASSPGRAEHRLRHDLTVAVLRGGSRSVAGLARKDRSSTPAEEDEVGEAVAALHDATLSDVRLSLSLSLSLGQWEVLHRPPVAFSRR